MRLRPLVRALAVALPLVACGGDDEPTAPPFTPATSVEEATFAPALGVDIRAAGWTRTPTGLYYRTLNTPPANAAIVTNGQRVPVRYTGWLANGVQFESSVYTFTVGAREVIAGWDQGIVGMRVGERRRLLIPPALGYGASGSGPIPGNAVLVFDVEVLPAG